MRFRGRARTCFMAAWLLMFLLAAITANAKDGRDFAGVYGFTNVQESGDTVHLTLHVRLANNSEADIKGAVITLMEGRTGVGVRGSFASVKVWRKNQDVNVSQEFTIPKREYQEWLQPPAQPNVVVIYKDAAGRTWEKGAQMRPVPGAFAASVQIQDSADTTSR